MIDLHIHSTCSDGLYSVREILEIAERKQCEIISIVDHNTCEAYDYIKENVGRYTGKIVSGCEYSTYHAGIPIELLGYDFSVSEMQVCLKKLYKYTSEQLWQFQQNIFFEKCKEHLIRLKIDFDDIMYSPLNSDFYYECIHGNLENVKYFDSEEDFNNKRVFYRKYMSNPQSIFYCNMEKFYPSPEEIISVIKDCGGKVFIPHIYEYGKYADFLLYELLSKYQIDGIECYYSKFSFEQRENMVVFSDKKHMLKSGGSDFHHGKKIQIGSGRGDLNIKQNMIGNWILETKNYNKLF